MQCIGYDYQKRRIKDWQTKSFAIMTCATIPDCTDRFACQEGDRVLFERLEMSRPAPKATVKMNCHSKQQQEQHSTPHTHVLGTWKQDVKRESQASAQDVTDHSIEADLATRKRGQSSSNMDVHTHVNTQALLKDETERKEVTETN